MGEHSLLFKLIKEPNVHTRMSNIHCLLLLRQWGGARLHGCDNSYPRDYRQPMRGSSEVTRDSNLEKQRAINEILSAKSCS